MRARFASRPRRLLAVLGAVLALLLTACGQAHDVTPDPSASTFGTVRIGKGPTRETEIIAWLYADNLKKAGYSTEVVDTGSTRADYLARMKDSGDRAVDITPDYTGNLLLHLTDGGTTNPLATASATPSPSASASASATGLNVRGMSSSDITSTLDRVLAPSLTIYDAAKAENKDALVVTQATAAKYGLSTINDLAKHCKDLTFGVPSGFPDQAYGTEGLKKLYGCQPGSYVTQDDQEKLSDALATDQVQVADLFSASSEIKDNNYVVLEDPQADFIAQQVVPVVRANTLPSSARDAVNNVSGMLGSNDLVFLDQLITGDDAISPEEAARFWLEQQSR